MKRPLHVFLILAIVGIAVYANSFQNDFIWDDEYLITKNTHVQSPSLKHSLQFFKDNLGLYGGDKNNFYRPLQELCYMLNYSICGLDPVGFHLVNLLLHLLVVYLAFLIISQISKNQPIALAASLLYLVHPFHVEAVAYIAGRADLLMACFFLLSVYLYIRYRQQGGKLYLYISAASFIFALLSKEIAIMLPIMLIFYDYAFPNEQREKKIKFRHVPYISIAAIYVALRTSMLNFKAPVAIMPEGIGLYERTLTFFKAFFEYVRLMILPFGLHMERRIPFAKSLFQPEVFFSTLFIVTVLVIMCYVRKRSRLAFFGLGWFFITIFPLSGIPMPMNAIVSDHFMYIPLIGVSLIAGLGIQQVAIFILRKSKDEDKKPRQARYAALLLLPLILYFSFLTISQNTVWQDEMTFFKHTLKYQPNNPKLHLNFGNTYSEYKMYENALEEYETALRLKPEYAPAYNNMGHIYMERSAIDKAIELYKKAIHIEDDYADAHFNLGNAYEEKGMLDEALAEYKKTLEFAPPYAGNVWNNIGVVYNKMGRFDEAIGAFRKGLKIDPKDPYLRNNLDKIMMK